MTASSPPDPAAPEERPRRSHGTTSEADPASGEAESVGGERFELRMGAIGRVDADVVDATMGAIGGVRAGSVEARQAVVGGVLAGRVDVSQSIAQSVVAREVRLSQAFARTIVAGTVHVDRATGIGIVIARRVDGDVRTLLDWRGAAAFGVAMGLVSGLVRSMAGGRRRGSGG